MNPTADVYEKIINDLHQTILLQSTIIDDNLLMEIDIDEDLVQVYRDSEPCRWGIPSDFSKISYFPEQVLQKHLKWISSLESEPYSLLH